MELKSEQLIHASQANTWAALNDIEILKAAIPGCTGITQIDATHFEVLVTAAIGPVKANFKGKLEITDSAPPDRYTLKFDGQSGAAGFGKGSAQVTLMPVDAYTTTLAYSANAQVGGKIAQVGSRLVDMAAQKMAGEFFAAFEKVVTEKYPRPAEAPAIAPPAAPVALWGSLKTWFRRLFLS